MEVAHSMMASTATAKRRTLIRRNEGCKVVVNSVSRIVAPFCSFICKVKLARKSVHCPGPQTRDPDIRRNAIKFGKQRRLQHRELLKPIPNRCFLSRIHIATVRFFHPSSPAKLFRRACEIGSIGVRFRDLLRPTILSQGLWKSCALLLNHCPM